MVNYQTSQYEILNLFCYSSHLGVFKYVRDKLHVTVSLDHPVALMDWDLWCIEDLEEKDGLPPRSFYQLTRRGSPINRTPFPMKLHQ